MNYTVVDLTGEKIEGIKSDSKYCVPMEIHEMQVRHCLKRGLPSFKPSKERRQDPIAVVGFGPSLHDTWEKIKGFKYVMSMSGSFVFLQERGITPTWHVECDPRPHKAAFHENPSKETQYLVASSCHPSVLDRLKDMNLQLWHVYSGEAITELPTYYPPGQWILTGGSNVGLRSLVLARALGFTDFHLFGFDNSFKDEASAAHAGSHPNSGYNKRIKVKVGEGSYYTTYTFIEYAKQFFHEMTKLPDCHATLYGVGLLQNMAKNKLTEPLDGTALAQETYFNSGAATVAFASRPTISEEYRQLNRKLHEERVDYGCSGGRRVETVLKLIKTVKPATVLDYGCGKGLLGRKLPFPIWEYDPAIPGKDTPPKPAELVVCTDVLEHIEPEYLEATLSDLKRVTRKIGYFIVHTGPSSKSLPDGRNCHLIQEGKEWWEKKLSEKFTIGKALQSGPEIHFVVSSRGFSANVETVKSEAA